MALSPSLSYPERKRGDYYSEYANERTVSRMMEGREYSCGYKSDSKTEAGQPNSVPPLTRTPGVTLSVSAGRRQLRVRSPESLRAVDLPDHLAERFRRIIKFADSRAKPFIDINKIPRDTLEAHGGILIYV